MKEHANHSEPKTVLPKTGDGREAYQAPTLKDMGSVTEITKTGVTNPGADGIYS